MGIFAARQRIGTRGYLWAGLFGNVQRDERSNPDGDSLEDDLSFVHDLGLFFVPSVVSQSNHNKALSPELRLDLTLNRNPAQPRILTFGVARPHTEFSLKEDLFQLADPNFTGNYVEQRDYHTFLAYTQLTERLNDRLSFIGQLRYQRVNGITTGSGMISNGGSPTPIQPRSVAISESHLLPSVVANYQVNKRTALRLLASRRFTDVTSSIFAPTETLLTTEGQTLPTGLPETANVVEIDGERYLSMGGLLKLFMFHTTADNLGRNLSSFSNPNNSNNLSSSFMLNHVERVGAGLRYERQLNRNLFGQLFGAINRTTNDTPGMPFDDQIAPYHPRFQAGFGLNYIDTSGNKIGVVVNRVGSFYADTSDAHATTRPRFPAKTYVDLVLAKEPTVHTEFFLQVSNIFNADQILFNDVPARGRRVQIGVTGRF